MTAELWLPLLRDCQLWDLDSGNGNDLWHKVLPIQQRLTQGDEIMLWPDEEHDVDGGPRWPVKEVYWDSRGTMQVELTMMLVAPSAEVSDLLGRKVRFSNDVDRFYAKRSWPDDPTAGLIRGGWRRWKGNQ